MKKFTLLLSTLMLTFIFSLFSGCELYIDDDLPDAEITSTAFVGTEALAGDESFDTDGEETNALEITSSEEKITIFTELEKELIDEDGSYTSKDDVASYIDTYGKLPSNFITKKEAQKRGWSKGESLWDSCPGMSIGGDRFGNYEGILPEKDGRSYKECDIDYNGGRRNSRRIVFSDDGLIYYTGDHYESFELLYGEE